MTEYCNHSTHRRYPHPAVAHIIHDDAGNLIVSAPSASGELRPHWNLLEGLVRSGEDYLEAAVRVSREFTGSSAEPSGVYAVLSDSDLPFLDSLADTMLIRRFWSGEWSVVSKSQGFFSQGAGI